ncbi:phage major tail tube protein [Pseudomonas aeruginosa]|uniref:phage major tail tube protein n=1 Tax=Pseudomonas aeruginosa TaxID=287 RepID=UPI00053DF00C|nr:phage major tail tube protein [Pseudomonas aeruginosa]MBO2834618.1 phage major tail tube protein [Pseudomonas aeruginosa]HEC0486931.1 phage major tail tube protein [Pseudomonas aeruginosa]HEC1420436.1 phage major tail tube protein [Pseudomonas aeruginosa]
MLTNRTRLIFAATLNGVPLMATIEEYTPPPFEFDTEEHRGGRFVPEEMITGLKALSSSLKLQGVGLPILAALGLAPGDDVLLTVQESGVDQDGEDWSVIHTQSGKLKKFADDAVKMGEKPMTEIDLGLRTYTRLDNGVPMIDVDTRTQKVIFGGKDMLKGARRLALLP